MKVLVTGARGFIGQRVSATLRQQGHDVVGLGRGGDPALGIIGRDLAADRLEPMLEGVNVVVHCAGQAHASGATEGDYQRNVVLATRRLVEAIVGTAGDSPASRVLINFSSIKAMGEILPVGSDERYECIPTTPYGRAKLEAETIVAEAASHIGTVVSLRPSPVFGPDGRGLIGMLTRLGSRGLLPRIGVDTGTRSYVHVDDVAAAVMACLTLPAGSHTFCLSDGKGYTLGRRPYCTPATPTMVSPVATRKPSSDGAGTGRPMGKSPALGRPPAIGLSCGF